MGQNKMSGDVGSEPGVYQDNKTKGSGGNSRVS